MTVSDVRSDPPMPTQQLICPDCHGTFPAPLRDAVRTHGCPYCGLWADTSDDPGGTDSRSVRSLDEERRS